MLHNIKKLYGHKLAAADGDIGHVKDFYFDDNTWVIRYLVVDTGAWLPGRLVLLTPHSFGLLDQFENILHVKLQKKQIENSPSIESQQPVSRQYELEYYNYYGWPTYWDGGAMWGLGGYPVVIPPPQYEIDQQKKLHHRDDKHLQSTRAVDGYQIQALDGVIGSVSGFMVDDRSWAIREVVVEAGHWYSGKGILISPEKIVRISYEESKVYVNLSKSDIQQTEVNHLARSHAGTPETAGFPTE